MYKLRTSRKEHICETWCEVQRKSWLARLLGEWVMVFKYDSTEEWICVFNWPSCRLVNNYYPR